MVTTISKYKLTESRPFPRRQFKAGCRQRIAAGIFFVIEITESKAAGDMRLKIIGNAASFQFPAQQLGKNLEMTRPIDESGAR
jgi:hypothetical protein